MDRSYPDTCFLKISRGNEKKTLKISNNVVRSSVFLHSLRNLFVNFVIRLFIGDGDIFITAWKSAPFFAPWRCWVIMGKILKKWLKLVTRRLLESLITNGSPKIVRIYLGKVTLARSSLGVWFDLTWNALKTVSLFLMTNIISKNALHVSWVQ